MDLVLSCLSIEKNDRPDASKVGRKLETIRKAFEKVQAENPAQTTPTGSGNNDRPPATGERLHNTAHISIPNNRWVAQDWSSGSVDSDGDLTYRVGRYGRGR